MTVAMVAAELDGDVVHVSETAAGAQSATGAAASHPPLQPLPDAPGQPTTRHARNDECHGISQPLGE